jgi:hypothetical protein
VLGDIHDEGCHAYPKLQYMIVDDSIITKFLKKSTSEG